VSSVTTVIEDSLFDRKIEMATAGLIPYYSQHPFKGSVKRKCIDIVILLLRKQKLIYQTLPFVISIHCQILEEGFFHIDRIKKRRISGIVMVVQDQLLFFLYHQ
jgi:hypothetical protein